MFPGSRISLSRSSLRSSAPTPRGHRETAPAPSPGSGRVNVVGGVVFCLLVSPAGGAAQGAAPYYGIGAGMTLPTGTFSADANGEGFKIGWQGMALVHFSLPVVEVRLDATYGENSANDRLKADASAAAGTAVDVKTKLLGGSVDWTFEAPTGPGSTGYVLVGIGFYNTKLSVSSGNVTADTSKTKFAWNAGVGVTRMFGRTQVFLEVRYFAISEPFGYGSDVRYFPIVAGVRFGRN